MNIVKGTSPFPRNLLEKAIITSTPKTVSSWRQNLKENSHPFLESTRTPDTNLPSGFFFSAKSGKKGGEGEEQKKKRKKGRLIAGNQTLDSTDKISNENIRN